MNSALLHAARTALAWLEKNAEPWTAVEEIAELRKAIRMAEKEIS